MMMNTDRDEMHDLEEFLTAARDAAPGLGAGLRHRILSDAVAQQRHATPLPVAAGRALPAWLSGLLSGWALPGAAGGAMAALGGFWIGLAAPLPVDAPLWMQDALIYLDIVTLPLVGVMDPLAMGY